MREKKRFLNFISGGQPDTARLVSDATILSSVNIYGVNYNILRIQNGMGGLMYAN